MACYWHVFFKHMLVNTSVALLLLFPRFNALISTFSLSVVSSALFIFSPLCSATHTSRTDWMLCVANQVGRQAEVIPSGQRQAVWVTVAAPCCFQFDSFLLAFLTLVGRSADLCLQWRNCGRKVKTTKTQREVPPWSSAPKINFFMSSNLRSSNPPPFSPLIHSLLKSLIMFTCWVSWEGGSAYMCVCVCVCVYSTVARTFKPVISAL